MGSNPTSPCLLHPWATYFIPNCFTQPPCKCGASCDHWSGSYRPLALLLLTITWMMIVSKINCQTIFIFNGNTFFIFFFCNIYNLTIRSSMSLKCLFLCTGLVKNTSLEAKFKQAKFPTIYCVFTYKKAKFPSKYQNFPAYSIPNSSFFSLCLRTVLLRPTFKFIIDLYLKVLATIPYFNFHFFHTCWYFCSLETPPMF